jgi:hypothetical protein
MNDQPSIWERLTSSYKLYALALQDFLAIDIDRVSLMKSALKSNDRTVAIHLLQYLAPSELNQLLNELVFLASFSHGGVGTVRQSIISMPREWVLSNIEQIAEPILESGTYDEYRRLLELYIVLDPVITLKLAQRAKKHEDPDVREVGIDFINKVDESKPTTKS